MTVCRQSTYKKHRAGARVQPSYCAGSSFRQQDRQTPRIGGTLTQQQLQARFTVGAADDMYEQEADRLADQALRMTEPKTQPQTIPQHNDNKGAKHQLPIQRLSSECDKGVQIQAVAQQPERSERPGPDFTFPADTVHGLTSLRSGGRSLPTSSRAFFEPRLGHDFSNVRIHTDDRAVRLARDVNARAFTTGRHVVFGSGQYRPDSSEGRSLLAHELVHVVQQNACVDRTVGDRMIQRTPAPGLPNCPGGVNGAPADAATKVTDADKLAAELADAAATFLDIESAAPDVNGDLYAAYSARFQLPPAGPTGGFIERFSGVEKPTLLEAVQGELEVLAKRFALVASMFNRRVDYHCVSGASSVASPGGPLAFDCASAKAFAHPAAGDLIGLCPTYWAASLSQQALILVHEAIHRNFGIGHGGQGTLNNTFCYNLFLADYFAITPLDSTKCP